MSAPNPFLDYGLIAVKRDWVPEWLWHFLCALTLNRVTPVHRWLCRRPKQ